jgi:hypothetical protein
MDARRKTWNERQQELRTSLSCLREHTRAIELFLIQHAMTHAGELSTSGPVSFEDEIWDNLTDPASRFIPEKCEHSIVWCFWHMTRCEDITTNMLITGTSQLLFNDGWFERMRVLSRDTGNSMSAAEIADFSARIDIPALRAYRLAVGTRTREVVQALRPGEFKRKTDPIRSQKVLAEGAVFSSQQWLIDYWSRLTVAGLLLMPSTRHNLIHLNEASKIKKIYFRK